ncbi:unnamed protein product [Spirodela intermedia]|uniref:Uncharacterized protein n=1 Tax=Spirodela intermedia TaxID=51605 RepID=A0A7I8LKR7_SPIIN|nr:unnamed protein product [Spirodela intermedia]
MEPISCVLSLSYDDWLPDIRGCVRRIDMRNILSYDDFSFLIFSLSGSSWSGSSFAKPTSGIRATRLHEIKKMAIVGENISKNKDHLVLSTIISAVSEDLLTILDAKKTAKENWEILRQWNLGMDRVIQSHIQGLKREFELLFIWPRLTQLWISR